MIEIPALVVADIHRFLACAQDASAQAECGLVGRETHRDALASVAVVLTTALVDMTDIVQAGVASAPELITFQLATEVLEGISPVRLPAILQRAHRGLCDAACQMRPYLVALRYRRASTI